MVHFALKQELNRPTGACFWCQSTDHRLQGCPLAKKALAHPDGRRVIRGFIQPRPTADTPSPKPIHQLQHDDHLDPDSDPLSDDDTVLHDNTSDFS